MIPGTRIVTLAPTDYRNPSGGISVAPSGATGTVVENIEGAPFPLAVRLDDYAQMPCGGAEPPFLYLPSEVCEVREGSYRFTHAPRDAALGERIKAAFLAGYDAGLNAEGNFADGSDAAERYASRVVA